MRDGSPIYPLGSLQDTAMQLSLLKDQQLEAKKFGALAYITLLSGSYPHAAKLQAKEIQKSISDLVDSTQYAIQYDFKSAEAIYLEKQRHQAAMMEAVNSFTKESINVTVKEAVGVSSKDALAQMGI